MGDIALYHASARAGIPMVRTKRSVRRCDSPQYSAERPRASRGLFAWAIAAASLLVLGALLVLLLRGFEPTKSTGAAPTPAAPAATEPMVVATAPATAPVTLKPSGVSASGVLTPSIDSQGNTITYEPAQAIDGASDTAWRVSGDGIGQWLQLDFASPVGVTRVGLIPGYDKVDPFDGTDRFAQNRVVRRARLEFSDGTSFEATFERRRDLQFVQAPQPTRTRWIRIVILDTYPPATDREPRDATPISEVVVEGVR